MTPEPCGPFCPFAACLECAYSGGESGDQKWLSPAETAKIRGSKTAPAGNRGLTAKTVEES